MKQTFKEFLQDNLSWTDFEKLFEHLGLSAKGATMLIDSPRKGNKLQLEKIVELLQKWTPDIDTEYLVKTFSFGVSEELENKN